MLRICIYLCLSFCLSLCLFIYPSWPLRIHAYMCSCAIQHTSKIRKPLSLSEPGNIALVSGRTRLRSLKTSRQSHDLTIKTMKTTKTKSKSKTRNRDFRRNHFDSSLVVLSQAASLLMVAGCGKVEKLESALKQSQYGPKSWRKPSRMI